MKVLFVYSGNKKAGISPFIKSQGESLIKNGVQLDYFPISKPGLSGYLIESFKLRKYLKRCAFDIIHAHYGMSALAAWIAQRKETLVVSFMGDDIVGTNKPDGSVTVSSKALARFNVFLANHLYDQVIVKSKEMKKELKAYNVSLIPNGVALEEFKSDSKTEARNRLGLGQNDKILIFVSDPSRVEKNFPLAQRALALLNDPKVKLVTVYNQLKDRLPIYYNAADALILTSFHEGSPNVIKEAMACNCPIVSTDVGDVREVLGNTEGCFLTSFSEKDVSDKIRMALDYAIKKNRTEGRKRIVEIGLDSETVTKMIIDIYKKVIV